MPICCKKDDFDLTSSNVILSYVNKDFSRYTLFVPLFKFSKVFLGLEDKFARYLKIKCFSRLYEVTKIANCVTSLICCGIDRFVRLDDEFVSERGLAKILGFPNGFFSSRTAYRFFEAFTGYNISQLEKVNLALLTEQKEYWYPKTGPMFVDLDMNTKSVEGKQIEKATRGYNRKSPGRLCLYWTIVHIAKVALFSELSSGGTSGKTILQKQIEHTEKLICMLGINSNISSKGNSQSKRIIYRVDGGYFSFNNLNFLNQRKFITRIPVNLSILKPFLKENYYSKLKWKKYSDWCEYVDLGNIDVPTGETEKTSLHLIFVRVLRKRKTILYPLITNLFSWNTKSIVKGYRGRQIIENCFRDTNQAFYSNKLPSSKFHGNQAFLWFIVLAYNTFFFFQKSSQGQTTKPINSQNNNPKVSQKTRRDKIQRKFGISRHI